MSLAFSGSKSKSAGVVSAIRKQTLLLNLKPIKKVSVKFDPFSQNAVTVRNFMYYFLSPKVINTNPSCIVRNQVVNDRSEPTIDVTLTNGESILFKCNNLTTLEILQQFNKHITPLAPQEEVVDTAVTKADKKKR
ncbi:39S ribosomal protein L53, mitochondrial [Daktulosphaira vitifoliae]|uniref:39S ribosomal protein L53, mitochondrial n=1 Tax=Daktulosphaira vitifoliae TaxID=58002 RepID=UPI0021AB0982|nr:39S ribosomal protein L53, mitochondrial [Daktulosphaira vitifoliae]